MNGIRRTQALIAAIGLIGGVVLFFVMVPIVASNTAPLAATIVSNPHFAGLASTPSFDGVLPTSELPYPAMISAGKSDPAQTGGWGRTWTPASTKVPSTLAMQVSVAPTEAVAKTVANQAVSFNLTKSQITAAHHTYVNTVKIGPLVGSGVSYQVPKQDVEASGSTPALHVAAQPGYALVFRVGRAVVFENISGPGLASSTAVALGQREVTQLNVTLPNLPPLQVLHDPIGSTLAFIVIALVVLAAAVLSPQVIDATRRRRAAEQAARAVRHRQMRGSKALKSKRRRY